MNHENYEQAMEEQENQVIEFASLEDLLDVNTNERAKGEGVAELINGKQIKLPLQAITADEEQAIRKQATRYIPQKRGGRVADMNELMYNSLIIDKATDSSRTNINWRSKELADKVGAKVPSPEYVIPKFLSLGGIGRLVEVIVDLSGIKDDFENQVEAAKN